MPGNYEMHLEDFGVCTCGNPSGEIEPLDLEYQDDVTGRWKTDRRVPSCADCFGLL